MLRVNNIGEPGALFHSPFHGDMLHVRQVPVDASELTTDEVTPGGYLKPGVAFAVPAAGIDSGDPRVMLDTGDAVEGVTFEAAKIANSNSDDDLTAAGTIQVAIGTRGVVSRARMEEMLGRSLTADEVAGFGVGAESLVELGP
jgi:hypothetical protein